MFGKALNVGEALKVCKSLFKRVLTIMIRENLQLYKLYWMFFFVEIEVQVGI